MYASDVLHVIYVGGRIILVVDVKYLCQLRARKARGIMAVERMFFLRVNPGYQ